MDLDKYFSKLLFVDCIYPGWLDTYHAANKAFIADLIAANIQKLYEREFVTNKIIVDGLNCCRDIVQNLGYKNFLIENFKSMLGDEKTKNIIIIPGCQNEGMLRNRVAKAVNLIKYFEKNLIIIASGANPLDNPKGVSKAKIPNECLFIRQELETLFQSRDIKVPHSYDELEDSMSSTTEMNIEHSLKLIDANDAHNIIIVSSTFHLIRLAEALENELTGILSNSGIRKDFIKNIFLMGAEIGGEKVEGSFTPTHSSGYVKLMFFDVFSQLIKYRAAEDFRENVMRNLKEHGYYVIANGGDKLVNDVIRCLGEVIQEKDITISDKPGKLASSTEAMPLHTDHYRADYIVWRCVQPAEEGGLTLLSDMRSAYNHLTDEQKTSLGKMSFETVFKIDNDLDYHPVVSQVRQLSHFYFVPFRKLENENETNRKIINELVDILNKQAIRFLLNKECVLIVDNKRMLHGRTAIEGEVKRLLKRYLIKARRK